jgi:FAD/FMN-containing dehydrogenase
MPQWSNWSGSVVASPERIERPTTEAALSALVAGAARARVAGTGHSFMPLCETDGLLLSLADMEGGIEVAADRASAWVPAGMAIGALTKALWDEGLSLANQGDIDKQAIAGALATATHGTGRTLGSLSTFAEGFRLVMADGSVVECDAERQSELFQAQRVSLGALGVMSRVRLSVMPAYRLRETLRRAPLSEILEQWDDLAARHRHVEFFVFPYADDALLKILEPVETGDDPPPGDLESGVMTFACEIARLVPALAPGLQLAPSARRPAPPPPIASSPPSGRRSSRRWNTRSPPPRAPTPSAPPSTRCAPAACPSPSRSNTAPWPATTSGSRP